MTFASLSSRTSPLPLSRNRRRFWPSLLLEIWAMPSHASGKSSWNRLDGNNNVSFSRRSLDPATRQTQIRPRRPARLVAQPTSAPSLPHFACDESGCAVLSFLPRGEFISPVFHSTASSDPPQCAREKCSCTTFHSFRCFENTCVPSPELYAPVEGRHRRPTTHRHMRLLQMVSELWRLLQVVVKRLSQRPQPANPLVLRRRKPHEPLVKQFQRAS